MDNIEIEFRDIKKHCFAHQCISCAFFNHREYECAFEKNPMDWDVDMIHMYLRILKKEKKERPMMYE